ncbi:methyl-accepting chemotaxis protein [Vibrio sp.]|nr:methyl-accepting chemotaxis protein [Vibrio sp.]
MIRTKFMIFSGVMVLLLLITTWIAHSSFNKIEHSFTDVVHSVANAEQNSQLSQEGIISSGSRLQQVNQAMLEVVSGIDRLDQKAALVSKKVNGISSDIKELILTVEELSEEVYDEEALSILEEVNDELADISERLQREAVLSIQDSSVQLDNYSKEITARAKDLDTLNQELSTQINLSDENLAITQNIAQLSTTSLSSLKTESRILVSVIVIILAIVIVSTVIGFKVVIEPINKTVALMKRVSSGEANLTQRLDTKNTTGEMLAISISFNQFIERIQNLVIDITDSTEKLRIASNQTLEAMKQGDAAMHEQRNEVEQIVTAISQINTASLEVAQNAQGAEDAAREVTTYTQSGRDTVDHAMSSVGRLVREVDSSVDVIDHLSQKSSSIYSVVDVIQSVSEQTNLLALNAAIEAARAGDHGRGFAVVADEVRSLASKADQSSTDIRNIIGEMLELTEQAVAVMQSNKTISEETLSGTNSTAEVFNSINGKIVSVKEMNINIATAATEQNQVAELLQDRIAAINTLSTETTEKVSSTVQTCEDLQAISEAITRKLEQFKV